MAYHKLAILPAEEEVGSILPRSPPPPPPTPPPTPPPSYGNVVRHLAPQAPPHPLLYLLCIALGLAASLSFPPYPPLSC